MGGTMISRVLEDDTLFADYFPHLEKRLDGTDSFRELHRDILRRVFRAGSGGGLVARMIRGSDGQIGLGVSGSEDGYFGLVYVGEPKKLNDLIEERDEGISVEEDVIGGGLFGGIEEDDSPVNVLVGARKFVEGWSSWRVGSMGLINVGSGEGPMIIQLFGRGVRLQGRNFSLKRSGATDGEHPEEVAPVETLGVFGLKANYMSEFREALEREDVDPNGYMTLPLLPIKEEKAFLEEGLLVPRPPDEDFADHKNIFLGHEENITVALDLSTRFETGGMAGNGDGGFESRSSKTGAGEWGVEGAYLDLLDWSAIHHDLLELKAAKGFRNLVIPPDIAEALMRGGFYKLVCDESVVKPERFEDLARLRDVAVSLLGKYVEKFYHCHQQRWDSERMTVEPLTRDHGNLFPNYKVMVKRSREDLMESVENLISQADEIYEDETEHLPNVHFDRHLYQPLLLEGDDAIKSAPAGLKDSERVFVEKLRNYCRAETNGDGKVFLLRNLSRGKGIGFFKTAGFYPDFIVWVKRGGRQRIVFVEPHGMRNDDAPDHNDKIQLHRDLEDISTRLSEEPGHEGVELDSFMVSATPFEDLKTQWNGIWDRDRFAEIHILFEDDLEGRMPRILYGGDT